MVNLSSVRPYRGVALAATIVFLMLCPAPAGFELMLYVPIVAIWALVIWVKSNSDSGKRKIALTKILIWVITFSAVVALHFYYQFSRKSAGDELLAEVLEYKARQGVYPKDLEAISPEAHALGRRNGVVYFYSDDRHYFWVESAWVVFSSRVYNFETGTWHDRTTG